MGDTSLFFINDEDQLQLQAMEAGEAFLYTELTATELSFWQIDLHLAFAPSNGNHVRVYLWLDRPVVDSANGYYIQLGEGGSDDRLRLFKLENGLALEQAVGTTSLGTNPNLTLQAKIDDDQWLISSRSMGEFDFSTEIIHEVDSTLARNGSDIFGLLCTFTDTRKDQFFFDNIQVLAQETIDTLGPLITDVAIIDGQTLQVFFSESLELTSAERVANYSVEPAGISASTAVLQSSRNSVVLILTQALVPNQPSILVASEISDLAGNQQTSQFDFQYELERVIKPYEILINEIYDDPTPSFGLPAAEFLELLIQTEDGTPISLKTITLKNFASEVSLPDLTFESGTHLILCEEKDTALFNDGGTVLGIEDLPTLINAGNSLSLLDRGEVIHQITYDDGWYQDNSKRAGGWSLELINPLDPCALQENWAASVGLTGGTPGQRNSLYDVARAGIQFQILRIVPLSDSRLMVEFNKTLTELLPAHFALQGGQAEVQNAARTGDNLEQAILVIDPPLVIGTQYSLTVDGVSDCLGQVIAKQTHEVLIPDVPIVGDIVINEILFNPVPGGSDFVEIFNLSDRAFQIQDLAFRVDHGQSQQIRPITSVAILPPNGYFVFTADPTDVMTRYPPVHSSSIFKSPLPNLPDQAGHLQLIYQKGVDSRLLDEISYDEDLHGRILRDKEGVSIERIDPSRITQDRSNWHSAASSEGFATPTRPNSQIQRTPALDAMFRVDPARLSPDGDGHEDFLSIHYSLPVSNRIANVWIYDSAGRLTKHLVNNETLAASGQIKWDGETDAGGKARIGIYTILIETFGENGSRQRYQEPCVVAGKLD